MASASPSTGCAPAACGCCCAASVRVTRNTPSVLSTTENSLPGVIRSVPHTVPKSSVRKPLVLPRVVPLATLVRPMAATNDQLAANHTVANGIASLAVSRTLSGGSLAACATMGSGSPSMRLRSSSASSHAWSSAWNAAWSSVSARRWEAARPERAWWFGADPSGMCGIGSGICSP